MKIDCIRENIIEVASLAALAVAAGDPIQAFRCLRMDVEENLLRVSGMNRELTISGVIGARVIENEEAFPITAEAGAFVAILNSSQENEIIRLTTRGRDLVIESAGLKARQRMMDWQMLPLPSRVEGYLGKLDAGATGVFRGFYATDNEGILAALRMDIAAGRFIVKATNQFRAAKMETNIVQPAGIDKVYTIPKKTAQLLPRIFKDQEIEVYGDASHLRFSTPAIDVTCLTMAQDLPDIGPAFDLDTGPISIAVPNKKLRQVISVITRLCDKNKSMQMHIDPANNTLVLKSTDAELGEHEQIIAGTGGTGEPITVRLNPEYLDDCLGSIREDGVIIRMPRSGNPIFVHLQFSPDEAHLIAPLVNR